MNTPLSILSWGAVSPGGLGVEALENFQNWPTTVASEVADPARQHLVATIDASILPEKWRMRPRFRRASPISHYMIEAAAQALAPHPQIERNRLGLIYVSFIGCSVYSIRFYRQFQKDGRRFASPMLFPETVANSPLSHLAAELEIGGPVYSQIGDKSCWSSALRTAACWLHNGDAEQVLVIGAEEFEPHQLEAFRSMRWLAKPYTRPFAEGAGAVLLGKGPHSGRPSIVSLKDGFCFRSRNESRTAAERCLAEFAPNLPVLDSAVGWIRPVAIAALKGRTVHDGIPALAHEAFGASCAWDTIRAAQRLSIHPEERVLIPYWGLSQQIGAAALEGTP